MSKHEGEKWGFDGGEGVLVNVLQDTPEAAAFEGLAYHGDTGPEGDTIEVTKCWPAKLRDITGGTADGAIDRMVDNCDVFGEYCQEVFDNTTKEQEEDLQCRFDAALKNWMKRWKRRPNAWHVGGSTFFKVVARNESGHATELVEITKAEHEALLKFAPAVE
jgi:hypothetical protein